MEWFSVSTKVLDRTDLSLQEKMCYVYLARFFQEAKEAITIKEIAASMGVEEMVAKGAFFSLRTKGLLKAESSVSPGTIIKAKAFEIDPIEEVCKIIDEPINSKEARIILNFAGGDLEKIKEKYKMAKASQFQDTVEVLIHELQKKQRSKVIKSDVSNDKPFEFEEASEEIVKYKNQVNTFQLNQMHKYKKK